MVDKGKLIVFEGSDGSGKTTQCALLKEYYTKNGKKVFTHHFPTYGTYHGALVEHYLKGEFGLPDECSSYFVNSLYAVDRAIVWKTKLKEYYNQGQMLLLDRYTTSSLLYQSVQFRDLEEKKRFLDFVVDFEYNKLGIKEPDRVLFFRLPWEISEKAIIAREQETGVQRDIHELDTSYLRKVHENSEFVADYLSWDIIECSRNGEQLSIDEIHEKVLTMLPKNKNK